MTAAERALLFELARAIKGLCWSQPHYVESLDEFIAFARGDEMADLEDELDSLKRENAELKKEVDNLASRLSAPTPSPTQ
jgi:cell division protein FtsB